MESLELYIDTPSRDLVETLHTSGQGLRQEGLTVEEPTRTPGFIEGAFEIAANFGLLAIPAGVAAGMIANWIGAALSKQSLGLESRLTVRKGETEIQLTLKAQDEEELTRLIAAALDELADD